MLCSICHSRPKESGAYCKECRHIYQQLYREHLRDNPDYDVSQRPCTNCKENPRMGGQRWCLPCIRTYKNTHRKSRTLMSPLARLKERCRSATRRMIKQGKLKVTPCECGSTDVQAHHTDYTRPDIVKWVCRECHRKEHDFKI
jgi:hypothetical protein